MHQTGRGIVVLAAGKGTRMRSALPKVLHPVCGVPMAMHVLNAARALEPEHIVVVVGHGADEVRTALAGPGVTFVEQTELLGTADAVGRAREALDGCREILVLNGDSPLIRAEALEALCAARGDAPLAFASHPAEDRGGFGRVQRDDAGQVAGIVEQADGDGGTVERNAGQYVFDGPWLWAHLARIPVSEKGEYYLTALPGFAHELGQPARTAPVDPMDVLGVDNRRTLAEAEREMRQRVLGQLMDAGVTIVDPATTYVDASVTVEPDVTIEPNCYLQGESLVGTGARIGPGSTLRNARIGAETTVQQSVIEDSAIGTQVRVGPFAHVRGHSDIGDGCEIGNYAEVNRSRLGRGVKMHHFSYVGDAEVGDDSNIAAGIITCNYDGVRKNRTVIGSGVFLGSDTMLVAPVTVGDGAQTGAGSVVTRDIPAGGRVAGVPARPLPDRVHDEERIGD